MTIVRTLVHALLVFALMNILNTIVVAKPLPGFVGLLSLVGTAAFLPFSAAVALAMHDQRSLFLLLVPVVLMVAWPFTTNDLPRLLIPLGAGVMAGTGVRHLILEGQSGPAKE